MAAEFKITQKAMEVLKQKYTLVNGKGGKIGTTGIKGTNEETGDTVITYGIVHKGVVPTFSESQPKRSGSAPNSDVWSGAFYWARFFGVHYKASVDILQQDFSVISYDAKNRKGDKTFIERVCINPYDRNKEAKYVEEVKLDRRVVLVTKQEEEQFAKHENGEDANLEGIFNKAAKIHCPTLDKGTFTWGQEQKFAQFLIEHGVKVVNAKE